MEKEKIRSEGKRELLTAKVRGGVQKYILNNFGVKVISLLVSVIVWMLIINIDDPNRVKTFTVPVETINEEALESVNKVYEIIEGNTAQVRVRGKKSVVDKLKASDIRATADLSNLSAVNAVAIVPVLIKNVSSEPTLECNQVLKVSLEDKASKQVKVNVVTEGTPEDGYFVGECTAKPNMIEITGGESVIQKIDSVNVTLNVNGVSENFSRRIEPVACDADGNEVVSSTLSYSSSRVRVSVKMLQTKSIDVDVKITGKPAEGYEFVEAACLPEKIEVAGSAKSLASLSKVTVPINIDGMRSSSNSVEQNISIQDYLDEDVTVLSDYALVSLRITIEKLEKRTITLQNSSIKFASLGSGLAARAIDENGTVDIVVQGRTSVLDELSEDTFTAYVDCSDLKEGKYSLRVQSDLGSTCTLLRADKLEIRISKRQAGENTSAPENTPDDETTESATPSPTATPRSTEEGQEDEEE